VVPADSRLQRLEQSRRRLAQIALSLRQRLQEEQALRSLHGQNEPSGATRQNDLDRQAETLRERASEYEQRARRLEEAERALAADRDALDRDAAAFRAGVQQIEDELAQRQAALERDVEKTWGACRQRGLELDEAERRLAEERAALQSRVQQAEAERAERQAAPEADMEGGRDREPSPRRDMQSEARSQPASRCEEARQLDIRRRELDCYAWHLRRAHRRLRKQAKHLARSAPQVCGDSAPAAAPAEPAPVPPEQAEQLRAEIALLRRQLQEKSGVILQLQSERRQPASAGAPAEEVAAYEAELNEFRCQLEADRQKLDEEMREIRARHSEVNEAAREAELELSRERAQLARERTQLERLREETRLEVARWQRDASVHERLAPLHRLKEQLDARRRSPESPSAAPAGEEQSGAAGRWRNLLNRLGNAPA
jgi:chromosome segregation ATPase